MTFEALPLVEVSWDQTAEADFLYYSVKRRVLDSGDEWMRLAVIRQADVTLYQDSTTWSGITYQYIVTQTIDVGGEEVESEEPAPVQGYVVCRSAFIHAPAALGTYVELRHVAAEDVLVRPMALLRARAAEAPIGFVGVEKGQRVTLRWRDLWIDEDEWTAIIALLDAMADSGRVLMLRHMTTPGIFGLIEAPRRTLSHTTHDPILTFVRTGYEEAV